MEYVYYLITPDPPDGDDEAIREKAQRDIMQVIVAKEGVDFQNQKFAMAGGQRCVFTPATEGAMMMWRRANGPHVFIRDTEVEAAAEPVDEPAYEPIIDDEE